MIGNESAHIIGGKHFTRSSCRLIGFQAGDGHDKAPQIGKTPEVHHEIRPVMWPGGRPCSPLHGVIGLQIIVMHLQIVEAARQLTWRYVASGPHC
jgi:hypothetical protein